MYIIIGEDAIFNSNTIKCIKKQDGIGINVDGFIISFECEQARNIAFNKIVYYLSKQDKIDINNGTFIHNYGKGELI